MATETLERTQTYQSDFEQLLARRKGREPQWLRDLRQLSMAKFAAAGFPTTDDEDWRFTNVTPMAEGAFRLETTHATRLNRAELERNLVAGPFEYALVFVDGRWSAELSKRPALPNSVVVSDLTAAIEQHPDLLHRHLARYADGDRDSFVALNAAFMECGAWVYVPRGVIVETPIHLIFVSTSASEGTVTHPHNLIVSEENSQVTVVESYLSLSDATYFTNEVTEVVAGENAVVEHYMIEHDSERAFNISTLRAEQHRDSNFTSHSVLTGGAIVRNNVHPVLNGSGCQSVLNGLYNPRGTQHMDNHMRVEHAKPHCDSRQFYKGIIDGEGRGVFAGRIIVHKDAQKTDAKQTNMNLLLSEKAQIDTKPQLEIYADDVKCTHGATIGQVDADAIFYLRSRGVPEATARSLLVYAFAGESLGRMKVEPVREAVEKLILARLPHAELLEGIS